MTAVALAIAGCSATTSDDDLLIITTTTVLGDIVANVAGDGAVVEVLLPIGADPHDFEPSARQAARLEQADLIVAVGLGLEEGMEDLLGAVESDGVPVLRMGPLVSPDWLGDSPQLDPHVWMDPTRMAVATGLVADALAVIEPVGPWQTNADAYRGVLAGLHSEIEAVVAAIPVQRRLLVTHHDSLRYFARTYGFEVVGVVVPGGTTLAQPSSADLADLIDEIAAREIPAVFGETTEPTGLLDAIAAEPGLSLVVVELHVASLGGEESNASTYVDMMRVNARLIAEALS